MEPDEAVVVHQQPQQQQQQQQQKQPKAKIENGPESSVDKMDILRNLARDFTPPARYADLKEAEKKYGVMMQQQAKVK